VAGGSEADSTEAQARSDAPTQDNAQVLTLSVALAVRKRRRQGPQESHPESPGEAASVEGGGPEMSGIGDPLIWHRKNKEPIFSLSISVEEEKWVELWSQAQLFHETFIAMNHTH
jgi:hypothetical protein